MKPLRLLKLLGISGALLGAAPLFAAPAAAAGTDGASAWARDAQAAVRLVSATLGTEGLERVAVGLEFSLAPGWKTYWRSPGSGGLPPEIQWSGSENLKSATVSWPAPQRFSLLGIDSFGYVDHLVLPIAAAVEDPARPLRLRAALNYLVCKEICVPGAASLALDLPPTAAAPSPHANVIARFAAKVPGDGRGAGVALEGARLEPGSGAEEGAVVEATFTALDPFQRPDLMIEGPRDVEFGPPAVVMSEGGRRATLRVAARAAAVDLAALEGQALRLTLVDGQRSMEREIVPLRALAGEGGLLLMLAFALLGGLVLNLMPCVLPVLSLKLLGLLKLGGAPQGQVRVSFLATAAGVVVSMWGLAALVLAGRAAGAAVGWGAQFQQPVFIAFMALLLTLFASNLLGWFEIALPQAVARPAARLLDRFGGASSGGSFLAGAFATLLATPCTAPFLGTAVGFALSRGAFEILAVFTALGIGLAAPYLAVAAVPAVAGRLPRPGRWMMTLRQVLGLGLAGSAVWLLTVLAAQLSPAAAAATGLLALLLALLLWLRPRLAATVERLGLAELRPLLPALQRHAPLAAAVLALLAVGMPAAWPARDQGAAPAATGVIAWQAFDEAAIPALVASGKTVLVDVTAEWCISCIVNKRLVLEREEVAAWLAAANVVAMQADWTRPDPGIAAFLARHRRYGIPFDIVYGPAAPGGVPLPEILSAAAVEAALTRASGVPPLAAR